ncbi:26S proteasome regulatory subunit rpn6 [Mycoemilia scoparia]|uniref:26S proteasome regulatory subunit rpn6 n=1 Tax=Mycoemilia scoparia TaxID=417184 RepID=A0A9W7ZYX3_9FUNG|nr:26S proteasome regulatory subunit rpn6 [Mycoemilia scoparia]
MTQTSAELLQQKEKEHISIIESYQPPATTTADNDGNATREDDSNAPVSEGPTLEQVEAALYGLWILYQTNNYGPGFDYLIEKFKPILATKYKTKSDQILLKLMSQVVRIPRKIASPSSSSEAAAAYETEPQLALLDKMIKEATQNGRTQLRQKLQIQLMDFCVVQKPQADLDDMIKNLLKEMKKLDDQLLSTEIFLLQSRLYFGVGNMSESRTSMTNARTAANQTGVPQILQADLDLQLGILHCESQDFANASSCFMESLEALAREEDRRRKVFNQHEAADNESQRQNNDEGHHSELEKAMVDFERMETEFLLAKIVQKQLESVVYLLLCKIMSHEPDQVNKVLEKNPRALPFKDHKIVQALIKISEAQKKREFKTFNETLAHFQLEIGEYRLLDKQVRLLYNDMIEKNLLQVLKPYSSVEIQHVANLVGLPISPVESYLSKMILDKTLSAILDHDKGQLQILDVGKADQSYSTVLETIENINGVVDSLYNKASKLA